MSEDENPKMPNIPAKKSQKEIELILKKISEQRAERMEAGTKGETRMVINFETGRKRW
jgi:hypothetical protein